MITVKIKNGFSACVCVANEHLLKLAFTLWLCHLGIAFVLVVVRTVIFLANGEIIVLEEKWKKLYKSDANLDYIVIDLDMF